MKNFFLVLFSFILFPSFAAAGKCPATLAGSLGFEFEVNGRPEKFFIVAWEESLGKVVTIGSNILSQKFIIGTKKAKIESKWNGGIVTVSDESYFVPFCADDKLIVPFRNSGSRFSAIEFFESDKKLSARWVKDFGVLKPVRPRSQDSIENSQQSKKRSVDTTPSPKAPRAPKPPVTKLENFVKPRTKPNPPSNLFEITYEPSPYVYPSVVPPSGNTHPPESHNSNQ